MEKTILISLNILVVFAVVISLFIIYKAKQNNKKLLEALKEKHQFVEYKEIKGTTITGHNGAKGTKENSLEGIEILMKDFEIIELDVQVFDGVHVLSHDAPKGSEEKLEDAFKLISKNDSVKINLDMKTTEKISEVKNLIEKYHLEKRAFFTGIEKKNVETVKENAPGVPYYLNMNVNRKKLGNKTYVQSIVDDVRKSGAVGLNVNFGSVDKNLVRTVQDAGFDVSLWTAKNELRFYRILDMKPNNLTTRF